MTDPDQQQQQQQESDGSLMMPQSTQIQQRTHIQMRVGDGAEHMESMDHGIKSEGEEDSQSQMGTFRLKPSLGRTPNHLTLR